MAFEEEDLPLKFEKNWLFGEGLDSYSCLRCDRVSSGLDATCTPSFQTENN